MSHYKIPKLTLVGAGPGDTELITVKGQNALKKADVVLYDALVNRDLLKYAPEKSLKVYVGKRNRQHTYTQEQINTLIVDLTLSHGHVVRLKGGDPFVFGRGQEEINYAETFNIETEVIPGISSSIGVPALSGIPVTHRGVSESFWVITGTTQDNTLSDDIYSAAKSNATIVILMGLSKIKEITEVFIQEGKNNLAVAVIQNGSLPEEKIVLGTVQTIVGEIEEKEIQAPAVIVIGEVVKQHKFFPLHILSTNYLYN